MSSPSRKILSPVGRPSRPVSEIRAVIRKVAAEAAKRERSSPELPAKAKAAKGLGEPKQL